MDATIAVTVNLTDVNEPPVFREASVEVFEVSENTHNLTSPSGNYEGTGAIEPDAGAKLTYSLTPQPSKPAGDKDSFTIDAATGWISLADEATIDYETYNTYEFRASVTDGLDADGNPDSGEDDFVRIIVRVGNLNEPGSVTFDSEQPAARSAITASLSDLDEGGTSYSLTNLTWKWEKSLDKSSWTVIAGATSAAYTPVDGDAKRYLRATARYKDAVGHGNPFEEASGVTANTVKINTPPVFSNAPTPAWSPRTPRREPRSAAR